MKNSMKQISRKLFAVVLAVALVASCLTVSFSVFAETTPFSVPSSSPAIPLYVGKQIALSDLSVQFGGNAYYAGNAITWTRDSGNFAAVEDGNLVGKAAGVSKFTVTNSLSATQTVYVLVNEQGNDEFTLVNLDFNQPGAYVDSDWQGGAVAGTSALNTYAQGKFANWGSASKIVSVSKAGTTVNALKLDPPGSEFGTKCAILKSEILKDFGDYTIETNVSSQLTGANADSAVEAVGIFARATLKEGTVDQGASILHDTTDSILFRIRGYGGLGYFSYNGTDYKNPSGRTFYLAQTPYNTYFTTGTTFAELEKATSDGTKVLKADAKTANDLTPRNIKIKLSGIDVKYSLDDNVVFDVTDHTNTIMRMEYTSDKNEYPATSTHNNNIGYSTYQGTLYGQNIKATKGTIGFSVNYGASTYVYDVKVTPGNISAELMPVMSDVQQKDGPFTPPQPTQPKVDVLESVSGAYKVPAVSPAIPLYVGKSIDVANLSIEIGGTYKSGSTLEWTALSGDAATYSEGKIAGVKAGTAGFTVTDGSNTQNVWVMVNAYGDNAFGVVNLDFTKGAFNADDWICGKLECTEDNYIYYKDQTAAATANKTNAQYFYENDKFGLYGSGKYNRIDTDSYLTTANVTVGGEAKTALLLPGTEGGSATKHYNAYAALYKSEALKDFKDYTVDADISVAMAVNKTEEALAAPGIFARAQVNEDAEIGDVIFAATDRTYAFRFRNYGGLGFFSITGDDTYVTSTDYTWAAPFLTGKFASISFFKGDIPYGYLNKGTAVNPAYILGPNAYGETNLTKRNIKVQLKDKDVKYTLDNSIDILDTIGKTNISAIALGYSSSNYSGATGLEQNNRKYSDVYNTWYNHNMAVNKSGTIGLNNNFGEDMYVYSLKAIPGNMSLSGQENKVPQMNNDYHDFTLAVNQKINFKAIYPDLALTDVKADEYELINGTFLAYGVVAEPVEIATDLAVNIIAEETADVSAEATRFADAEMTVISNGNNEFTVKTAGEIVPGSLKVNGEAVYGNEGEDGKTFTFTVIDPTNFTVTAEYATKAENLEEAPVLGASIREAQPGAVTEAIRFVSRFGAIRLDGDNPALFSTADKTFLNVGTLLIPAALLGANDLAIPEDLVETFNPASETTVAIGKYNAVNVPIVNLEQATETFSDAFVQMDYGEITDEGQKMIMLDADMVAVNYIQYTDDETGAIGYIYSTPEIKSYNDIEKEAHPITNADPDISEAVLLGRAYVSGGNTVFSVEISGSYKIDWQVLDSADGVVASGVAPLGTKILSVTAEGTNLRLEGTLLDTNDNIVQFGEGKDAVFAIAVQ